MSKDFSISVTLDLKPIQESVNLILKNVTQLGGVFFEEKGDFSSKLRTEPLFREEASVLVYGELLKDPFVGFAGIKVEMPEAKSFFYLTFRSIQESLSICLIPINIKFLESDKNFIDKAFYIKVMAEICNGMHILNFDLDN